MPFAIPIVPLALGLAGLLPFWALAVALVLPGSFHLPPAVFEGALATYAAIIMSFLGGIRWGLAVAASERRREGDGVVFAGSVVPSLVAWALLLAPAPWRLIGLALTALILGPIDLGLVRAGLAPRWFGTLRLVLSTGAGLALMLGAVGIR